MMQLQVRLKSSDLCDSIPVVPEMLTIGELAARSGVATSALRFYEERGLISSERASSGHRRFNRPVIRRVAFIVFAQKVGLSLVEIRAILLKLPRNRTPDRADWARISGKKGERITYIRTIVQGKAGQEPGKSIETMPNTGQYL